jgi:hypothetical protein
VQRVHEQYRQICQDDKFINFVHHVENQKRFMFKNLMKEITMLQASGANTKNSQKLTSMLFTVADQDAELESRDMANQAKSAIPKLDHAEFSCVGSETCLRQKMISKLFVDSLQMQKGGPVQQQFSTIPDSGKPTDLQNFSASHKQKDDKTCNDFANLIEQITAKKLEVNKDKYHPTSRPTST